MYVCTSSPCRAVGQEELGGIISTTIALGSMFKMAYYLYCASLSSELLRVLPRHTLLTLRSCDFRAVVVRFGRLARRLFEPGIVFTQCASAIQSRSLLRSSKIVL